LQLVVEGQGDAVGHTPVLWRVFFGATGGEQGRAGKNRHGKVIYQQSSIHGRKKRLSWFETLNSVLAGSIGSKAGSELLQTNPFFQHYDYQNT
jgi:hypothetical protein